MIKTIVIASYKSGGVVFQRFYGSDLRTESAQAMFMQKLRDTTGFEWPNLVSDYAEQCAYMENMHVTYKLIGDVVLTMVGTDKHDQLLLLEACRAFELALRKILKLKDQSTEARILQSYSKVCMIVDEMIIDGEIDQMDANMISSVISMTN